ncbi:DUF1906 domain-containing protein [Streptomyces sp. NPDC057702]|uniref:DUF1906 domain-containing protein n=1 Tax=unclassified Streptomyces TaxID=2593676 RepID=UPI0036A481E3
MVALLTALASLCGVLVAGPVSVAESRDEGRTGGATLGRSAPVRTAPSRITPVHVTPARARTAPARAEQRAVAPARTTPDTPPDTPAARRPVGAPAVEAPKRRVFQGWAFDRCQAPPVSTMRAWSASPYRGVGVYFGGRGRHCRTQKYLDKGWVREVTKLGWNVLPVYVGSQSPCVIAKMKRKYTIGDNAWAQGRAEARDAVASAGRLGMVRGSALYLDMEAYHHRRYRCGRTTLAFVRSWSREVRQQGYVPGFYSSANSGVRHMEQSRKAGEPDLPEVMWFARWNVPPSLYGEKWLDRQAWHPHRRIHQYAGDVVEEHGGRRLAIDRNRVDAPVAVVR